MCYFDVESHVEKPLWGFLAENMMDVSLRVKERFLQEMGYIDGFTAELYKEGEKWSFNAFDASSESGMNVQSFCIYPISYRDF